MSDKDFISYQQAGVSIEANDQMVDKIKDSVQKTHGPRVMDLHGGFAGLFSLENNPIFGKNWKNPVLVSCTDGVGTKVLLAKEMGKLDTVGQDLVAMSLNDMLVLGAQPLFFLDYLAIDRLVPGKIAEMVGGIAAACRKCDCALIGGETAEMPDVYRKDDFDMAGFAVGVVEKDNIIKGDSVKAGDVILGLESSGVHSNGYSLVRNICFKKNDFKMTDTFEALGGKTLGEVLLEPTRLYVRPVVGMLEKYAEKKSVHAMAHITGGGLVGNIPRVLPDNCDAVLDKNSWPKPDVFGFLQEKGPVKEQEMYRVFNMGIGFVLAVSADDAEGVKAALEAGGEKVYTIGQVTEGTGKVVLK